MGNVSPTESRPSLNRVQFIRMKTQMVLKVHLYGDFISTLRHFGKIVLTTLKTKQKVTQSEKEMTTTHKK